MKSLLEITFSVKDPRNPSTLNQTNTDSKNQNKNHIIVKPIYIHHSAQNLKSKTITTIDKTGTIIIRG